MKIAILGVGVVGSALRNYVYDQSPGVEVALYDPPKDLFDDISGYDLAFICVPIPTLEDRSQDLSHLHACLNHLQQKSVSFDKPIFIKSTLLPGTTSKLQASGRPFRKLCHMPEFLTERFADSDMEDQDVVCGGREILSFEDMKAVESLFPFKKVNFMRNVEAELCKYAHNGFAAVKVNYFNLIKMVSDILGADYKTVLSGALVSGLIEKTHTQVPGHDGLAGYGGKCLPKDLKAFIGLLHTHDIPYASLLATEDENRYHRDESKCTSS